jgi:hypothetical protein
MQDPRRIHGSTEPRPHSAVHILDSTSPNHTRFRWPCSVFWQCTITRHQKTRRSVRNSAGDVSDYFGCSEKISRSGHFDETGGSGKIVMNSEIRILFGLSNNLM